MNHHWSTAEDFHVASELFQANYPTIQRNDSFFAKRCPVLVESCQATSVPHITRTILDVNTVVQPCNNVHFANSLRRLGTLTKR